MSSRSRTFSPTLLEPESEDFGEATETCARAACAPGNNGPIANDFVTEVKEARESTARAACNPKTKLVEAKLEMVRTAGLFQCGADVSRVCRLNTRNRFQHDEID